MKEIIWGSVSVPLIVVNTLEVDPSLFDRFISDDLAIRTMQAIASGSTNEFYFDPEHNDISFNEEEEGEKERIY